MMLISIERRRWLVVAATAMALAAAACGGSASGATATTGGAGGSGAGATPTSGATGSPPGGTAPSPIESSAGVLPAVDPCQLVPAGEASRLAGTSFTGGAEDQAENDAKQCIYGAQTANVLTVFVLQAASRAQAEAGKQQFLAALRQKADNQLHVTQIPNLADGGVLGRASASVNGIAFAGSAIVVLKGTIAFGISDIVLGGDEPSDAALLQEARAVLSRLP